MPTPFYMDENVTSAITDGLRDCGVDVLTAREDGHGQTDDVQILDRALSLGRAVFTHDQDFLIEARRRQQAGLEFAGVIFSPQEESLIGRIIDDLEYIWLIGDETEVWNNVHFIPF